MMRRDASRRLDHLPDDLDPELIAACLDASRRIRLDRQVAYERPVILESEVGELALLPVERNGSRLLAPFRLSKSTQALSGELIISGRDPLPLLIGEAVGDQDATTAWICALLGFADATCVEFGPSTREPRRDPAMQFPPLPTQVPHQAASGRALPRRQRWPDYLEPVGHWIRYSGSFVAGHRRHLQDGHDASDEARHRARQVGIVLRPHETWVRAHTRGVPDGVEMRFAWRPPVPLNRPTRNDQPTDPAQTTW